MAEDEPNGDVPGIQDGPYTGPRATDFTPEPDHSDDAGYVTRTRFLSNVAIAGGGVLTAAILVPVVGFAVAQPLKGEDYRWVYIGPASEFLKNPPPYANPSPSTKIGEVTSLAVSGPDPDADRRIYVVYGLKDPGSRPQPEPGEDSAVFESRFAKWASGLIAADFDLIAIWNRCAHLGCPVAYSPGSAGYVCPCHGGAYNSRGLVTGGPPPRPLDRVDIKIVDGSKSYTAEQIVKGEDRVPLAVAATSNNPNLQVLVGKPYSIDQQQETFPLADPGVPVSGTLSHMYPFT
ncbi:MAG: ubiquinol-cytochrome c reductase iron-sulfur subunit [Miltoncostaeaceae bacterium]